MSNARSEFIQGAKDVAPLFVGVVPFGIIAGVTAVSVGLSAVQAMGMSFIVVAGAAQMAALELMRTEAFWGVVLLTVGIINLRHVMYSASLAPHFGRMPLRWRLFLAYPLVDQAFLLSILRYNQNPDMRDKRWYFLGVALSITTVWHTATLIGVLVGTQVPPEWSLDFAIPLVFMTLLFPAITDRPTLLAALAAAIVAILARPLPFNLGFVAAAFIGIVVGLLAEWRKPPVVKSRELPLMEAAEHE